MSYFLEYMVPVGESERKFAVPVSDAHAGDILPVRAPDPRGAGALPARTNVPGGDAEEAKTAAGDILSHCRANEARLYEDPNNSSATGSGRLVARYSAEAGWENA